MTGRCERDLASSTYIDARSSVSRRYISPMPWTTASGEAWRSRGLALNIDSEPTQRSARERPGAPFVTFVATSSATHRSHISGSGDDKRRASSRGTRTPAGRTWSHMCRSSHPCDERTRVQLKERWRAPSALCEPAPPTRGCQRSDSGTELTSAVRRHTVNAPQPNMIEWVKVSCQSKIEETSGAPQRTGGWLLARSSSACPLHQKRVATH
jgi:hypothetical protein